MSLPSQERLAKARVLVVGDAMLDRYWHGAVDRISPEAPVPIVRVLREEARLGGAANAAVNVASLGAKCTLLAMAGDDEPGETMRGLLQKHGVATSLHMADATTVKLRVIGQHQQMLRADFEAEPTAEGLKTMMVDFGRLVLAHDVVLLSDYKKGALYNAMHMITKARSVGVPVLVDPNGTDWGWYRGATVIKPNRAELAKVAGGVIGDFGTWVDETTLGRLAQEVCGGLAIGALLLTRSEDGMTLFDSDGRLDLPTAAREVADVTGAGDTVIATLAALMAAGMSLRDSAPYANKAAGVVVGRFGTAAPSYADLV